MEGLDGNDQILGRDGDDIIDGGAGNDTLDGGAGVDVVKGGAGDDTIIGTDDAGQLDQYEGGDGTDTVTYAGAGSGVTVSLVAGQTTAGGGAATFDVFISIENVNGSSFDDTLSVSAGGSASVSGGGNDTLGGDALRPVAHSTCVWRR